MCIIAEHLARVVSACVTPLGMRNERVWQRFDLWSCLGDDEDGSCLEMTGIELDPIIDRLCVSSQRVQQDTEEARISNRIYRGSVYILVYVYFYIEIVCLESSCFIVAHIFSFIF